MPRERRRTSKASDRLRRLLVVVPYLVQHPGTELVEVERLFGVGEEELVEDLHLLFMSGLPPYGPGDLIGVDIEDGRVWIDMADYFARPLRLTRAEALALYLRGKALAATPGLHEATALASALGKIERSLGPDTLGELTRRVEAAEAAEEALETLEVVRRAVADHERLRIDYYSASSAATRRRDVDPEEVFHAIGHWYVVAWDHLSDEERLFRADRIRAAEPTGQRFEPRGLAGAGRALYTPTERDVSVRLRLGDDARWVAEYYEVTEAVEREDGLEVVLPASQLEWVARLVLRLGGAARVLEPDGLKDRVRELARQTQKPYLDSSPDAV